MSWGGYTFIINLLPIHCLASVLSGRLTGKLYVAYAPLVVLGTLLAGKLWCISSLMNYGSLCPLQFGSTYCMLPLLANACVFSTARLCFNPM